MVIRKCLIIKRTNNYVAFKLPNGYTSIISSKFIRSKETDSYIYLSLPYDYKVNVRQTYYNLDKKEYVVNDERTIYPRQLTWQLHRIEEHLKEGKALEDLLEYNSLEVNDDKSPF